MVGFTIQCEGSKGRDAKKLPDHSKAEVQHGFLLGNLEVFEGQQIQPLHSEMDKVNNRLVFFGSSEWRRFETEKN